LKLFQRTHPFILVSLTNLYLFESGSCTLSGEKTCVCVRIYNIIFCLEILSALGALVRLRFVYKKRFASLSSRKPRVNAFNLRCSSRASAANVVENRQSTLFCSLRRARRPNRSQPIIRDEREAKKNQLSSANWLLLPLNSLERANDSARIPRRYLLFMCCQKTILTKRRTAKITWAEKYWSGILSQFNNLFTLCQQLSPSKSIHQQKDSLQTVELHTFDMDSTLSAN